MRTLSKVKHSLLQLCYAKSLHSLFIPGTSESVMTSVLLPDCPRIVDPVNPANNVYLSGLGPDPYAEVGDGKWRMLRERISTIDITKTAEKIMEG